MQGLFTPPSDARGQVRELSFRDERYLRLEERVEQLTRDKALLHP